MSTTNFEMAMMYDFDKTLCTKDMQEYNFIPAIGMTPQDFWAEAETLSKKEKMDQTLAYMYLMLRKSANAGKPIRRKDFVAAGKNIDFFPGVADWFERIDRYAEAHEITVRHYIISSGLKEIIEGTAIKKNFAKIYASEFFYDENKVAVWPRLAVNYTTKTQFLFRINKGILEVSDNNELNQYLPDNERKVPFSNMIYIGDGLTDVPCMKLVKLNGGKSIAVYQNHQKNTVNRLLQDQRVDFIAPADYSAGSKLEKIVRNIVDHIQSGNRLVATHRHQLSELPKSAKNGTSL